jgi:alpha 1,2-mannosyltransferase
MKRGYTYIVTLLSICAIYFGSLYVVSKTSNSTAPYLDSILKEKSETIEEEQEVILSEPQSCLIDTRPAIIDNSTKREKAVIVILVRNNELNPMRRTLREFEE